MRRISHVIRPSDDAFEMAVRRVQQMHLESGLWDEAFTSGEMLHNVMESLAILLEDASKLSTKAGCGHRIQIAGSSPTFDRGWVLHHLPCAEDLMHYRSFDVNPLRYAEGSSKDGHRRPHRAVLDLEQDIDFTRDVVARLGRTPRNTGESAA